MHMSLEVISKLDQIIEDHNSGKAQAMIAAGAGIHESVIRSFLNLARKLGANVKRNPRATLATPEARAIFRQAMQEAHAKIARLPNGRG